MVGHRSGRVRRSALGTLLVLALTGVAVASGGAASAAPTEGGSRGAAGGGDPYFPYAGNGGYDVLHYDLDLRYTPRPTRTSCAAGSRASPPSRCGRPRTCPGSTSTCGGSRSGR